MNTPKTMENFELDRTPIEGINLIEASAGTGKTYTIEGVFLRLLLEKKIPVEKILVVTFTEAATSELRERIREKIHTARDLFSQESSSSEDPFLQSLLENHPDQQVVQKQLSMALGGFDEAAIFTIHGFCRKMLIDFAFESQSNFNMELIKNQDNLLSELGRDFWRNRFYEEKDEELVQFLLKEFKHPDHFSKSLTTILPRPVNKLVTGLKNHDTNHWLEQSDSIYKELREHWKRESANIESMLLTHKNLDHRSYSKRWVPVWCKKLDQYAKEGNRFIPPKELEKFFASSILAKTKKGTEAPTHPLFECCEKLDQALNNILVSLRFEFLEWAKIKLKTQKIEFNLRSFDDLLKDLRLALTGEGGEALAEKIREKFSVALIDEFQDTDPIQFKIFNTIFTPQKSDLFFIGDPKQSIYNFRGADIFTYIDAQKRAEKTYTLDTNWRSDQDLVSAVNSIFSFNHNPFAFEEIRFFPSRGAEKNPPRALTINGQQPSPFQVMFLPSQNGKPWSKTEAKKRIIDGVCHEITRLLNLGTAGKATIQEKKEEKIEPGKIAILVRTHIEAQQIQRALKELRVPSVINTKESIFDSDEFEEIRKILLAIVHCGDESLVRSALATQIMGVSGNRLHELSKAEREHEWEAILEQFRFYHDTWKEKGFYGMVRHWLAGESIRTRLLKYQNGERRLTNLLQVLELLHEAEITNKLGMMRLLKWAHTSRFEQEVREENQIRLETDDDALQILTIHTSKGLEYPIVFCPFSWDARDINEVFYHEEKGGLALDLGSPDFEVHQEQARRENLAENLRLLYVALTRAKHRCYMVWGEINKTESSPLTYLFHQGELKNRDLWKDLEQLAESSLGNIGLEQLPENDGTLFSPSEQQEDLVHCPPFWGDLSRDWGITSFTGLASKKARNPEGPDRDRLDSAPVAPEEKVEQELAPSDSMFTLPGGSTTGICLHEILEELNFQENEQEILSRVREKLKKYNFEEKWESIVSEMVFHVTRRGFSIEDDTIRLIELKERQKISEMEFYFPIRQLDVKALKAFLKKQEESEIAQALLQTLNKLDFHQIEGYMKGFIDLVFEWKGKYYLLDWKTNQLGSEVEDYEPERLKEYVQEHNFVLQYIIYTLALHKMLKSRLPNYQFQSHFGGVFYCFLRGITALEEENFGIYYNPMNEAANLIEQLELYLKREVR